MTERQTDSLRERRLKLLEALFILVGIVSAAAAIKPPSGFEYAYAYLFALFILSGLVTYAVILFEIPLDGTGEKMGLGRR